jgi:hypothetical protein
MPVRMLAATSILIALIMGAPASAKTPNEWVKLLTRVHGFLARTCQSELRSVRTVN